MIGQGVGGAHSARGGSLVSRWNLRAARVVMMNSPCVSSIEAPKEVVVEDG